MHSQFAKVAESWLLQIWLYNDAHIRWVDGSDVEYKFIFLNLYDMRVDWSKMYACF